MGIRPPVLALSLHLGMLGAGTSGAAGAILALSGFRQGECGDGVAPFSSQLEWAGRHLGTNRAGSGTGRWGVKWWSG